jgi:hypothetical protein
MTTHDELHGFLARQRIAVLATATVEGPPESAAMRYGVNPALEIAFHTWAESRKCRNLLAQPACSLVMTDGDITVQYEGVASHYRAGDDFPGREQLTADLRHVDAASVLFVVRPRWIRYSDYSQNPPEIVEFSF